MLLQIFVRIEKQLIVKQNSNLLPISSGAVLFGINVNTCIHLYVHQMLVFLHHTMHHFHTYVPLYLYYLFSLFIYV